MKIAYIITRYKPNGGVFTSLDNLRAYLHKNNIQSDAYILGKRKDIKDYIFFNKKDDLKNLLEYDIVELYHCWGKDTISDKLLNTLKELIKLNKLIFRAHEVKSLRSKSKTNHSEIALQLKNAAFVLEGEEEGNYYASKLNLEKVAVIKYIYNRIKDNNFDLKKKNKIIVPSRIDFCKGLEFIKSYIESPYNKRRIEFYSENINEKFVYFTKFDTILKSDLYKPISDYRNNLDEIYKEARITLNFTWFGEGSGGRAELIVMESWDHGAIPFLDKRWVEVKGILKDGYNCIGIERNNKNQLAEKIEEIFNNEEYAKSLILNGFKTLNNIVKENSNIIDFYKDFIKADINKRIIQRRKFL